MFLPNTLVTKKDICATILVLGGLLFRMILHSLSFISLMILTPHHQNQMSFHLFHPPFRRLTHPQNMFLITDESINSSDDFLMSNRSHRSILLLSLHLQWRLKFSWFISRDSPKTITPWYKDSSTMWHSKTQSKVSSPHLYHSSSSNKSDESYGRSGIKGGSELWVWCIALKQYLATCSMIHGTECSL